MKAPHEPKRFPSRRQFVEGWWANLLVRFDREPISVDAILDTGSQYTIMPRQIADEVVDTSILPFDSRALDSAYGEMWTSPVLADIEVKTSHGKSKSAIITVLIARDVNDAFDFVIVGMNAMDRLKVRMSFGGAGKRRLSGPGYAGINPTEIAMTLISPILRRGK